MKKIYLAGPCDTEHRTLMVSVAKAIRELKDIEVYCPFELKIENAWDMPQEEWAQRVFEKDLEALDSSDILVMVSTGRHSTAGTNWEQGYAYCKGMQVQVYQITEEQTSLMTFCGCDKFINCASSNIAEVIQSGINNCINSDVTCKTILT